MGKDFLKEYIELTSKFRQAKFKEKRIIFKQLEKLNQDYEKGKFNDDIPKLKVV